MAATLNKYNLLLAAYELCGSYSTFEPCKRAEQLLAEAIQRGDLSKDDGWKRTKSTTGEATSLWKRDPLTTPEKLERFSKQAQGLHGIKKLRYPVMKLIYKFLLRKQRQLIGAIVEVIQQLYQEAVEVHAAELLAHHAGR